MSLFSKQVKMLEVLLLIFRFYYRSIAIAVLTLRCIDSLMYCYTLNLCVQFLMIRATFKVIHLPAQSAIPIIYVVILQRKSYSVAQG